MLARAFLHRDLLQEMSYRLHFVWQVTSLLFSVVALFFLSGMFKGGAPEGVAAYGAEYFPFALVGFVLAESMWACLQSFSGALRYDQVVGTLEAMMATPVEMHWIVVYSGLYPLAFTGVRIVAVMAVGALLGAGFPAGALLSVIPVFLLSLLTFGALGLVSASMTLVLKKGDPVAALFSALSFLFGGAVYPVSAIPDALQPVSWALPITWSIEASRKVLLQRASLSDISTELAVLSAFALAAIALAALAVRWSTAFTRRGGFRVY